MSSTGGSLSRRTLSPPPQYDPYAPQLGYLSESVHRQLTERECGIFDRGLADYHRRRNIKAFVECLSLVLNSNQKRQLLIPIRDTYVKPSDVKKFNELVQMHGLATSLKRKKKAEAELEKARQQTSDQGIKKIEAKRDTNGEWGFNIRGGSELGIGVFVSWVEPGSNAHRSGLQVGDQILKANDTNFESISHYEAVELMKSSKKLRLWVLSRGRVPGSRMAHKVYRWVDPEGRPTTPPPDPFEVMEQKARGDYKVLSEADERKVTLMVDGGRELGLSIRGGVEHGLGVYISQVEEGSVAEIYGLKVGDQILQVNGISFVNIVHADAANALRAQPCMVMKLKDVGKLPHSRITTYGKTQWYKNPPHTLTRSGQTTQESPAFSRGAGTQVMFKKQDTSIHGKGIMNEVARSVLTSQEFSTFTYYINQYEHHGLPIEDLVTPLLDLLNTPEKLHLISEVRGIIRARDLNRFNELCVHREITAKRMASKENAPSLDGEQEDGKAILTDFATQPFQYTAQVHHEDPEAFQLSPPKEAEFSYGSGERTLTPGLAEDGDEFQIEDGRDRIPQKLTPPRHKPKSTPVFHLPPPPSSTPSVQTSTPEASNSPDPEAVLANTLKDRRKWMSPGAREQSLEETWDGQWTDTSLSSIRTPPEVQRRGLHIVNAPGVRLSVVERKVRSETEEKLRKEFEQKERRLLEEQRRRLEEEQRERERALQTEREAMEEKLREIEERTRQELEEQIRQEAEDEMKRKLEEKEHQLRQEQARKAQEDEEVRAQMEREAMEEHIRKVEERTKEELEEKIWKEAEEHIREEFETRMQRERELLTKQAEQQQKISEHTVQEAEEKIRHEVEERLRSEYEEKIRKEKGKLKKAQEAERKRREDEERRKQEEEIARLEAEEQARIELEDQIRKEAEAKARTEYERRLQQETEARARLAQEIQAHKAAEERLEMEKQDILDSEERKMLDGQRKRREAEEAEQRQMEEERRQEEEEEMRQQDAQKKKRQELERKREENIRRREEEKKLMRNTEGGVRRKKQEDQRKQQEQQRQQEEQRQREQQRQEEQQRQLEEQRQREQQRQQEEQRQREQQRQQEEQRQRKQQRQEEEQRQREQQRQQEQQRREDEERNRQEATAPKVVLRRQRDAERRAALGVQHVKVNFGEDQQQPKQTRQQAIEEERLKAERRLRRSMEKVLAKQNANTKPATGAGVDQTDLAAPPAPGGKSFAGYDNLHGDILQITITKVSKRLGIAIDGGANTKQKAVLIREISPDGCAAQTGRGLSVGQQILQVNGTDLFGLKHRETVMAIKTAFEGPLNKTMELVVLDRGDSE